MLGLRQTGIDVVPVRAGPPRPVMRASLVLLSAARVRGVESGGLRSAVAAKRGLAIVSREMIALRQLALSASLRRAGPLDGLIQIGTEYRLRSGVPFVTYEDQTVAQAAATPFSFVHELPPRVVERWRGRQLWAYARARGCCMQTRWAGRSAVEDYGLSASAVHAVGVGRNYSAPPGQRDWSSPRFLLVAAEWERKNGPGVLRALARLREQRPDATLDVVGNHPRIDADGVTAHGRLRMGVAAERDRMQHLYRTSTCLVMPSFHEPAGTAYADAGGAGMPSIGTTRGGSAEMVGAGGRVVDPGDDGALLAAMRELAEPATAARLGQLAQRHSELFTWPRVAERVLRALAPPGVALEPLAGFL